MQFFLPDTVCSVSLHRSVPKSDSLIVAISRVKGGFFSFSRVPGGNLPFSRIKRGIFVFSRADGGILGFSRFSGGISKIFFPLIYWKQDLLVIKPNIKSLFSRIEGGDFKFSRFSGGNFPFSLILRDDYNVVFLFLSPYIIRFINHLTESSESSKNSRAEGGKKAFSRILGGVFCFSRNIGGDYLFSPTMRGIFIVSRTEGGVFAFSPAKSGVLTYLMSTK